MSGAAKPEPSLWRRYRTDVLIAVGALVLVAMVVFFREILSPLAVALALAYVLNPVMRWSQRHRVPRGVAATLIFFVLLALFVLAVLFAVPPLVGQLYDFGVTVVGEPEIEEPPGYRDLNENGEWDHGYIPAALQWARGVAARLQTGESTWFDRVLGSIGTSQDAREGLLKGALTTLKQAGTGVVAFLWNLQGFAFGVGLTAFYLFFLLMNFDRVVEAVHRRLPGKYRPRIEDVVGKIDAAVSAFLRGRILVCLVVGVLTAVGLAIVGVPYWYLIGVATGVAGVVPYLPIFVGLVPAILVAWFDAGSVWAVGGTAAVFIVVQTLEGWVLTPFIQGRAVGLHPVTLMVALLAGYEVFGLFGLIAAVPLASTVKILAKEFVLPKVDELAREKPAEST
ncbi:MAG: AI-2E family transporter [Phycisphaerae bacterium]